MSDFWRVGLDNYRLNPAWYYTAPALAWDAALKKTGVQLEFLKDPDMLLVFERGVRGGVSMVSKRHAVANNPYMESYDSKQPRRYNI